MLLVLLACRSGVIRYPSGSDDLRSAWFQTAEDSEPAFGDALTETVVLLSNTEIACDGIPSLTEDKSSIDSPEEAAILTRENARVVVLFLFQRKLASLEGNYVLESEHTGKNVTTSNGVASAAYLGVNEAVLMDEDGLNRFYLPGSNPGDCELVVEVPSPGDITITSADDHLKGSFALDSIDVSGRFDAKECSNNPEFMNTLQAVILLRDNLSMCVDESADASSGD